MCNIADVTTPTCIECRRPFRPNRQLATLPIGRRIAFDPERGHVWRICQGCGAWNLLGREESELGLAELRHRSGGGTGVADHGVAITTLGADLELLRLGTKSELAAGALALGERRRALLHIGTTATVIPLALLTVLVVGTMVGWLSISWRLAGQLLAWGSAARLLRLRARHAYRLPVTVRSVVIAAVGFVVGVLIPWAPRPEAAGFIAFNDLLLQVAMTAIWAVSTAMITHLSMKQRLPSGSKIAVGVDDLRAVRLSWDSAAGTITATTPDGRLLDQTDTEYLLGHVTEWILGLPDETIEQAHALVATTATLGELLQMLDDVRGDRVDVRIADLPWAYVAALDLAIGRARRQADLEGVSTAAQEVARIAESLDRD